MGKTVISVEHLSKRYNLGVIGTGTVSRDLNRWWARLRGKPDPYAKIGEVDHGNRSGESIMALNNVSFSVEQGEVLGIIGRNGAGKSTLLKILSQVTAPTSGKVKVKGRIGSLLEVGTGFHPELTGRENVYLNGAILGMSRSEVDRKFDEIVDFSGVEKFIDTPVKRYSSGMYVRLAFAVAAHLEPEILIVDEVLAVGDVEFQKKCLGKMGDVAHEGRTVLFVSHNMAAIEALCRNVFLFENGNITKAGPSKKIVNCYLEQNQIIGLVKKQSEKIEFQGIKYKYYKLHEDLAMRLPIKVKVDELLYVNINISILDTVGNKIIRLQSGIVNDELCLHGGTINYIDFHIEAPKLAPGKYYLNIYCSDFSGVLFWTHNIPAFTIESLTLEEHNKLLYDKVGFIMPKFSVRVTNGL